jgi:hypothetical protein
LLAHALCQQSPKQGLDCGAQQKHQGLSLSLAREVAEFVD